MAAITDKKTGQRNLELRTLVIFDSRPRWRECKIIVIVLNEFQKPWDSNRKISKFVAASKQQLTAFRGTVNLKNNFENYLNRILY